MDFRCLALGVVGGVKGFGTEYSPRVSKVSLARLGEHGSMAMTLAFKACNSAKGRARLRRCPGTSTSSCVLRLLRLTRAGIVVSHPGDRRLSGASTRDSGSAFGG